MVRFWATTYVILNTGNQRENPTCWEKLVITVKGQRIVFSVCLCLCVCTCMSKMGSLLQLLFDYFTLRNVLLYSVILLATWLFYKAGIEPFLSPIRKVIMDGRCYSYGTPYQ